MQIETKRLILRPPKKSDCKDIVEGIGDIDVSKNLSVVPYPYKKTDALWWINKSKKDWRKKESYHFLIELKSEKKVIGATGISKAKDKDKVCTTGSWINNKYWRRGYILEAKIPVIDFIFDKLKLRKIETSAFLGNKASQKMSKKLGFKKEGLKRKSIVCKSTGKIHDVVIYGLLNEEWKKVRPKLIKQIIKKTKEI